MDPRDLFEGKLSNAMLREWLQLAEGMLKARYTPSAEKFYTICHIIFPNRCCKKLPSIHVTVIFIIEIMSRNRGYILKISLTK